MTFIFHKDKCIGCGACAVACMDQNDLDPREEVPFRSTRTLETVENGRAVFTCLSYSCMHCTDAPCVSACPSGCIRKDPDTGLTLYDNTRCIGCHSCTLACPFGAPGFDTAGKMQKCDGCALRQENGLQPACVRVCPFGAIEAHWTEDGDEIARNRWASNLQHYGE